jgi:hypothetical protein
VNQFGQPCLAQVPRLNLSTCLVINRLNVVNVLQGDAVVEVERYTSAISVALPRLHAPLNPGEVAGRLVFPSMYVIVQQTMLKSAEFGASKAPSDRPGEYSCSRTSPADIK